MNKSIVIAAVIAAAALAACGKKEEAKVEAPESIISVFYTPDLVPANSDYNEAFKTLSGLPIEYDFETEKLTFRYHLSNIDFNTISLSKFEFPKSGYRVMTYDENKRNKAND